MINDKNIAKYVKDNYKITESYTAHKVIDKIQPLLQSNYGGDLDCTLTSITCALYYYYPSTDVNTIYNTVEKVAKKYFYEASKLGTQPVFVRAIIKDTAKILKFKVKPESCYFKLNSLTYNGIKQRIDKKIPIVLNISWDGNKYYDNHTVLIIGYREYKDKKFLAVYDNWSKEIRYVDYQKLNFLISINPIKKA